jgi:hypothetical protein
MKLEIRIESCPFQYVVDPWFGDGPRRGRPRLYTSFFSLSHLVAGFAKLYVYFELLLAAIDGDFYGVAGAVVIHDLG